MRFILSLLLALVTAASAQANDAFKPASDAWPNVFVGGDTCRVYVLRDGDAALLINLGDGGVLEKLPEIGVKNVEWVLFTDHHREHCQGAGKLDRSKTKVAAPKAEQALFETPLQFRKWRPTLNDQYTVHGASYVRPPAAPIPLDRQLAADEVFTWRGFEIRCLSTPGTSPGGMTYVIKNGDKSAAFVGGLMHDGSKMSNWFDIEWDYGFAKGLDALISSVDSLDKLSLTTVFPSQGPVIANAGEQIKSYHQKLTAFRPDYLRGYPVNNLTKRPKADPNVKPTAIPQIVQVTPHLYKFSDELAGKNFSIIIADSGKGLLLDCGLFSELLLAELVKEMQTHLGLKSLDALWINHMHGDHFTLGAELRKRYGTKIWTLDKIVDKVENPLRYDYCALITSYNPAYEGLKVDRPLKDGEVVEWEGLKLQIDWMPGQTEFGNCLWLELDGKRIAFTGDNLFGDPSDPEQNGHEAVVARNSAIFEEGYLLGSGYLRDLKPDIIMGAHNVLMANPQEFVDRYHAWSKRIIAHYKRLLPDPNYEYQFDPFWVSAYPYRVDLQQERTQQVAITVRNFRDQPQTHHVKLKLPPGIIAEPAVLEGTVDAKSRKTFQVKLTADPDKTAAGVQMIPFDITLDGKRYGEWFDFVVQVKAEQADASQAKVYEEWPFNGTEASRRQTETAKALGLPVVLETALAKDGPVLKWRLIPAGKFMMGSPNTESGHEGDERLHPETISEPFYMLETQLTAQQHLALLGERPPADAKEADLQLPATLTYRDTADKVLPALAKHAPAGWKVILPDQVRLEYAARAGVATMNHGGDTPEDADPFAWTRKNSEKKMHPVARKRPNAWGLHDVIGNRWHWFWRAGKGYGDESENDHIVYGGTYHAESGGNGARLANIMISNQAEGARFALIRAESAVPKGHPETNQASK